MSSGSAHRVVACFEQPGQECGSKTRIRRWQQPAVLNDRLAID
jgi:hypothetical protein